MILSRDERPPFGCLHSPKDPLSSSLLSAASVARSPWPGAAPQPAFACRDIGIWGAQLLVLRTGSVDSLDASCCLDLADAFWK